VTVLIFLQVLTEVVERDFLLLAELLLLLMDVGVPNFVLAAFFLHVDFVQVDDTFLEFFVVSKMVQAVVDVLLELSLVTFLLVRVLLELLRLRCEAVLTELQVTNDKLEVLCHPMEMLHFLVHLSRLLI
jgi:hypothetical protein